MRSTVGPLAPAVYWRRRAVVLGALLLAVILLFVSCGGNSDDRKRGGGKGSSASQAPTPEPEDSSSPEPEPSFSDDKPGDGNVPVPADPRPSGTVPNPSGDGAATGTNNNANVPADGSCADQELSLNPLPAAKTVKRGAVLAITIKIRNTSTRACTRDLGAGAQELYLDQAARKFWSSDTCNPDRSTNLIKMQPGGEYTFNLTWNGQQANKCTGTLPAGPAPAPGAYQLRARLDTKLSEPVAITITA